MTIRDCIRALSAYPIPDETIEMYAIKRGVLLDEEASIDLVLNVPYMLMTADIYLWLYHSPSISQGGQSYSFSEKSFFKDQARSIYKQYGDDEDVSGLESRFGYKGSRL